MEKYSVWIFGAGRGASYNDNSKALFEFASAHGKSNHVRAIWITQSNAVYEQLRKENKEVCMFYSLRGFYLAFAADVLIFSHSFLDLPLSVYVWSRAKIIVQLWHGTPLKNIEHNSNWSSFYKLLIRLFLAYIGRHYDLMITATELNVAIYERINTFSRGVVRVTGQPRNDILIGQKKNDSIPHRTVLYLPTWRERMFKLDVFKGFPQSELEALLAKNQAQMVIKLHCEDTPAYKALLQRFEKSPVIQIQNYDDAYTLLADTDILLTDYSSAYFDFLLLDRPIIFTPFDLRSYEKHKGFYYDYSSVTPGPKASNWAEVLVHLGDVLQGRDTYKEERARMQRKFNTFIDSGSSQRVFQEILQIPKP